LFFLFTINTTSFYILVYFVRQITSRKSSQLEIEDIDYNNKLLKERGGYYKKSIKHKNKTHKKKQYKNSHNKKTYLKKKHHKKTHHKKNKKGQHNTRK
jgi:hypothetical protein